jgi:hypothetical protein
MVWATTLLVCTFRSASIYSGPVLWADRRHEIEPAPHKQSPCKSSETYSHTENVGAESVAKWNYLAAQLLSLR